MNNNGSTLEQDAAHIVVVEAYQGSIEFLSDEPEERATARGLGLPLERIAEELGCRITVLCWDEWYRFEETKIRVPIPATRPVHPWEPGSFSLNAEPRSVKRVMVAARDPEDGVLFGDRDLNPRSYGLINDGGLLWFVAYCLDKELESLYRTDPFQVVMLPGWGGLGYVSQLARATGAHHSVDVPFAVVVTDLSVNRQTANQEGLWTRQAIIRRQMEDVSLALADLVFVFGPRSEQIAINGRLPEASPPLHIPRFVDDSLLNQIDVASRQSKAIHKDTQFFLYEPQQAASGVLSVLDATILLSRKGFRFDRPVTSAGPPMIFAPMKPRSFQEYWSSRGSVRELICESQWEWDRHYPHLDDSFPVRLYPSFFDHLPNIWAELARGSFTLLSPAAAEGLAPGEPLPPESLIQGDPLPEKVAECMERIASIDIRSLDQIRREMCTRVVAAHRGQVHSQLIDETVEALRQIICCPPGPQDLSRVALLFLDRREPLRKLAGRDREPPLSAAGPSTQSGTLSVVVTCHEMDTLIKEAIDSVWASERKPDEVLLVDDGSYGQETIATLQKIEEEGTRKNLPIRIIRQRNKGLAAARNEGLEAATGEFISFLDGDDTVEPHFYRIALQVAQQYPRFGGVAAWSTIFGPDLPDGFWNAPQAELPFLFIENSVCVPFLTRTELLRGLGGYDTRQRYNYEDWELAIRMLEAGWPIVTIPRHLLRYRIRRNSLYRSMTHVQNQVMRETLFSTHRGTVRKFAVEIAAQLEHQWMQLAYPDSSPPRSEFSSPHAAPRLKQIRRMTRRVLRRLQGID